MHATRTCSICGAEHEGLPLDWGFRHPAYWDAQRDSVDGLLTSDVCIIRGDEGNADFFVRGVVEIPIVEPNVQSQESFGIGACVSLSNASLDRYVAEPEADEHEQGEPWFGWLSNSVPVYPETLNLKTNVHLRGERLRPFIEVEPSVHPLAQDQHNRISIARAYDLSAQWLHR